MIERLKDIFGGSDALAPRTLPAIPAPLVDLLPWRAWDEAGEFYVNAGSLGFVLELPPFAGVDEGTLDALAGTLADSAPERAVVQVIHWTSPRYGAAIAQWAGPREGAGGLLAVMAKRREALFRSAGWRPLHAGGPPYTLNDCRVFLAASLPGRPGPASETALGGFRRALEGALASIGTWARRTEPDELLSLAAELVSPDTEGAHDGGLDRPERRWSPRDPVHLQCAAPGRAMSVAPEGLLFHHPDGADVAVRALTARAYPEVWPGWRGNALIGDFYRDFLQPGAPVLTSLTIMMGETADGERAFLKSARATQQAGTGIARYLPGLPEKARDWRFVTERLKEGERLVRACYAICVYAPTGAMDEAEQAVRAIYHGQGWRLGAERYAHLPAWLSCLPMAPAGGLDADLARLGRMKTLLTSSVVNLAPVHGEWRGQRANPDAPPALLLVGRRGQPAPWSPFANEAGNYNVAVTGKSGSGKSVLMQELVAGIAGAGGEAVVIDDGRSFQHTAEALGGAFIAFGKDPARLNPFAMIDKETAARDGDYREECFAMLAAVIGRMCRRRGRIDDVEAALIDEAIARAWDEAGNEADLGLRAEKPRIRRRQASGRYGARARSLAAGRRDGKALRGRRDARARCRAHRVRTRRAQGARRPSGRRAHARGLSGDAEDVPRTEDAAQGDRDRRGLGPALGRRQQGVSGRRCPPREKIPGGARDRHPERERLLRQPGGPRGLGQLRLDDISRAKGRVRRTPEAGEAHPLRPRDGARAQEPRHGGRAPCGTRAPRPRRLARRPARARPRVGRALLLARTRLRRRRAVEGRRPHDGGGRTAHRG